MKLGNRPIRDVVLAAVLVGTVVLLAVPAWAHVTVRPQSAPKGSFEILTFSVPNERPDADTTQLEVDFPTDKPIPFVRVQPKPGWTYTVEKTTLTKPIEVFGDEITEVISKVTWTGGVIKPGEFDLFLVSAGPLPEKGKQVYFPAVQTYSSGEVVEWIEKPTSGGSEPEHPSPVLKLTKATG